MDNDTDTAYILNITNSIAVSPEELAAALDFLSDPCNEISNHHHHLVLLKYLFDDKALAIAYRLQAMGKIIDADHLPNWAAQRLPNGDIRLSDAVWEAIATTPISAADGKPYFNWDTFLDAIVLNTDE